MSQRLLVLILLLAIAAGSAVWLLQPQTTESATNTAIFETLPASSSSITQVSVNNREGLLLAATLSNGQWMTSHDPELQAYPVDEARLADLVNALVNAKRVEAKTAKPENYSRLGVEDVMSEDSQSALVTLQSATDKWEIIVGNRAKSGTQTFVRKPSQRQSWLISEPITLPDSPRGWLKQPILDVAFDSIISMQKEGDEGWVIEKAEGEENFTLTAMPDGRDLQYDTILNGMVNALLDLRFDDVKPLNTESWDTLEEVVSLSLETINGEIVTGTVRTDGEASWIVLTGNGIAPKYWQGLQYQISEYNVGQLSRGVEDFLSSPPEEGEVGPQAPEQ